MATSVGCAGSADELGVIRSPATSCGPGSFSVRLGGVRCCTTRCGAVHAVPRVAVGGGVRRTQHVDRVGVAERRGPCRAALIRSARLGPWRARTHTVGVTAVGVGTVSVRLRFTGSSGDSAMAAAHRMPSGLSAQPDRPSSSDPRSHCATAEFGGGPGTSTVWRRLTGWAKPFASYWVTVKSVMPNCTPAEPSSVATAVIRTHGVSP